MWNPMCIFLYYFHILLSCPLKLNIYAKWNWYLCLNETNDPLQLPSQGCPVVPVPYIVKAILSPTKKSNSISVINLFPFRHGVCSRYFTALLSPPQRQCQTVLYGLFVSAKAVLLTLFFFFGIVLASLDSFLLHKNFRISLSSSTKNLLGFLLELHWICVSVWGELASSHTEFPDPEIYFLTSLKCFPLMCANNFIIFSEDFANILLSLFLSTLHLGH